MMRIGLVCVAAAMGAGLYQTKHEVSLLDRELRGIARAVEEAEGRRLALAAEWAWMNEPERLRATAQRHLALEPMQPTQFVRATEAERRLPPVVAYAGPVALFAAREPASGPGTGPATGPGTLALLSRSLAPTRMVTAPVGRSAAEAGSALPAIAARPMAAPPGGTPSEVAPTAMLATTAVAGALPPSPAGLPAAVAPRPGEVARVAPRPAARPAPRPAAEAAAGPTSTTPAPTLPAILAPTLAPTLASAMRPTLAQAPPPPRADPAAAALPGSALGAATRPALAPPVPFGSARAAEFGGQPR